MVCVGPAHQVGGVGGLAVALRDAPGPPPHPREQLEGAVPGEQRPEHEGPPVLQEQQLFKHISRTTVSQDVFLNSYLKIKRNFGP